MATFEDRRKELEEEFDALTEEYKKLVEQGRLINQRESKIKARQLQLQGALQEAEYLLGKNTEPTEKSAVKPAEKPR